MKLQLALDDITLENAVKLVDEVQDYIDIIEIGTPMVIEYGMNIVRTMKEHFPEKEILADLKIMDAGYYEAEEALKAGADYITVLGVTDNLTVKGCVDAANAYHGQVVVDMICVPWFSTFNVADMFITVGAAILVVYILLKDREFLSDKKKDEPHDDTAGS